MLDTGPAISLTVWCAVLIVAALIFFAQLAQSADRNARWIEANHLAMAVAMVVMVWWPADALGAVVQAGAFAVFGLAWGVLAVGARSSGDRAAALCHLVMNWAMSWMLLLMILPGGHGGGGGSSGAGHEGHGSAPAADPSAAGNPNPVIDLAPITWIWAGGLILVAGWWLISIVRSRPSARSTTPRNLLAHLCHAAMAIAMAWMSALMT